jgi:membrane-associated phospholipid phosphatase
MNAAVCRTVALACAIGAPVASLAGGGPFGIDSEVSGQATGIWSRGNQKALQTAVVAGVIGGALWEGSETRLGRTLWQSTDAVLLGEVGHTALNLAFGRLRPSQTTDPDQWFKSRGHSFPSGEVTMIAAAVTPIVLEYGPDHPAVYALELLPAYDAVARVRSHAHWQSDVLAAWALGTAVGYYAHSRAQPFTVMVLPRGLTVGWRKTF